MKLTSGAFENGAEIPLPYTCDGSDFSPPLEWEDVPEGAESLAIICEDPDAPAGVWTHWVIYNIPSAAFRLAAKIPAMADHPSGLCQGLNSWGRLEYGGPCPPSGTHRYFFTLYALDRVLDVEPGSSRDKVEKAMQGHILAEAKLMGTYTHH